MDFFQAQDRARRQTHVLVGLFAAAVVAIILAVYLVVVVAGGVWAGATPGLDPTLFGLVALGTGTVIGLGSAFRTAQLRSGGPAVAELLGGRRVESDTRDPGERRLVNVVEEMAVASGTPVPAMYVMEHEASINAFAAGYGIDDAAVAVTRGTLEHLDRDELQGVIAHEFSHILNGDMRLNIRLIGLLFGILLLAVVGRGFLRGGMISRRRRDGRAALVGLALVALGYIGVFFGKLIKAAVSRQREFLADAAAVQFTRNPQGIAGALKKIGAHSAGSTIGDHHAEELSHLFFANGVGKALSRATSTHPPLEERIRRIDPAWDGRFEAAARSARPGTPEREVGAAATSPVEGSSAGGGVVGGPASHADVAVGAAALLAAAGAPTAEHVSHARRLLARLPAEVRDAAHDPSGARALLLALVYETGAPESPGDDRESGGETDDFEDVSPQIRERARALAPHVREIEAGARMPLVDLTLPSLERLSEDEARRFRAAVERAVRSDGRIRAFEFALVHVLWRRLPGARRAPARSSQGTASLPDLTREIEVILSALARAGSEIEPEVEVAFRSGARHLAPDLALSLRPAEQVGFGEVDAALGRLEVGSLEVRRRILEACAATILADRQIRPDEGELLRAVAECLGIPLPPIVATG